MKRRIVWVMMLFLLVGLLCGCKKQEQVEEPVVSSAEPSGEDLEPTVTPEETEQTFSKKYKNGVAISIDSSKENNVTIEYQGKSAEYQWDVQMSQQEPVCIKARYESLTRKAIYIIMPEDSTENYLTVPEYAGNVHIIDCDTLAELDSQNAFEDWMEYTDLSVDDKNTLLLEICPYVSYVYNYPTIEIAPEDEYEIIYDDTTHYTKSLTAYQRVGVKLNGNVTWLGYYMDDITFDNLSDSNGEIVGFYPYDLTTDGTMDSLVLKILDGQICQIPLECSLDVDQDGELETIGLKAEGLERDAYEAYDIYKLSVGEDSIIKQGLGIYCSLYATSLDHKTIQVMTQETGDSCDFYTYVFSYENGEIKEAGGVGCLVDDITVHEDYFLGKAEICHFQCYAVTKEYQYKEGKIVEIPLDFYEMGNTVTAKQEIQTYASNSTDTLGITIAKDSDVIILGSDLKEWVKIQDLDSGETGWLRVLNTDVSLPDGTTIYSDDLFTGLYFYG